MGRAQFSPPHRGLYLGSYPDPPAFRIPLVSARIPLQAAPSPGALPRRAKFSLAWRVSARVYPARTSFGREFSAWSTGCDGFASSVPSALTSMPQLALRRSLGPRASVQSPRSLAMAPRRQWRLGQRPTQSTRVSTASHRDADGSPPMVTRSAHFAAFPSRNPSHGALRHAATFSSGVIFRRRRGPRDRSRATRRFTGNPARPHVASDFHAGVSPRSPAARRALRFCLPASGQRSLRLWRRHAPSAVRSACDRHPHGAATAAAGPSRHQMCDLRAPARRVAPHGCMFRSDALVRAPRSDGVNAFFTQRVPFVARGGLRAPACDRRSPARLRIHSSDSRCGT